LRHSGWGLRRLGEGGFDQGVGEQPLENPREALGGGQHLPVAPQRLFLDSGVHRLELGVQGPELFGDSLEVSGGAQQHGDGEARFASALPWTSCSRHGGSGPLALGFWEGPVDTVNQERPRSYSLLSTMKTAVLKITARSGGGYLKRLYVEAGTDWQKQSVAEEPLAADLKEGAGVDVDGAPLERDRLVELFQKNPDSKELHTTIGGFLYTALFTGKTGEQWEAIRPGGTDGAASIRLFLDIEPKELKPLPWELLYFEEDLSPLFVDPRYLVARGRLEAVGKQASGEPPLRALVVVACDPVNDAQIRPNEELIALERSFRKLRHVVDLVVLRQPTREQLVKAYQAHQPHLFHFLGHGRLPAGSKDPCLCLWTPSGEEEWLVDEITNDLRSWNGLQVAFMNACFSASAVGTTWSLTRALHAVGARVVIGMQSEIPGDKAAIFSERLYSQLAERVPLEQALREARRALTLGTDGLKRHDWALPSVSFERATENLFSLPKPELPVAQEFDQLRSLVDRQEERLALSQSERQQQYPSLFILEGEEDSGKTCLLHWLLERWALKGKRILHVDLAKDPTQASLNELDFLRRVRRGDASSHGDCLICRPLPAAHFQEFDALEQAFTRWQSGRDDPPPPHPVVVAPGPGPLAPQGTLEEAPFARAFEAFARGLQEAAGGSELVLALDHISGVLPTSFIRHIRPMLLEAVAGGTLTSVRVVVCANRKEFDVYGLRTLDQRKGVLRVQVPKFSKAQFPALTEEYCRARLDASVSLKKLLQAIAGLHHLIDDDWSPDFLREIVEPMVRKAGG
jgi:hypothetical protein